MPRKISPMPEQYSKIPRCHETFTSPLVAGDLDSKCKHSPEPAIVEILEIFVANFHTACVAISLCSVFKHGRKFCLIRRRRERDDEDGFLVLDESATFFSSHLQKANETAKRSTKGDMQTPRRW
jgi:hypothetical protein